MGAATSWSACRPTTRRGTGSRASTGCPNSCARRSGTSTPCTSSRRASRSTSTAGRIATPRRRPSTRAPAASRGRRRLRGGAVVSSGPLLSARGIVKSFGGRSVLDGLDLELAAGARIGVLGPNGGGKSTLLRILAGAEVPDAGTVTSRRGLVLASLPQIVDGDERSGLATVLDARPELTALEGDLAQAERRL